MKWVEPENYPVPEGLFAEVGGHPLVTRALVDRVLLHRPDEIERLSTVDIADEIQRARAFLDPDHYQPRLFSEIPGIVKAVDRLNRAIQKGERILIWGDFDVDGQTSTALLAGLLRSLGARADTYIPDRIKESHGINLSTLQELLANDYQVLLTCDTGISAFEAVDFANQRNVDVIITDHHDLPSRLPEALTVVNPRLLPGNHPLSFLPGVGVAYELAVGLLMQFNREEEKNQFLDLVTLGIIADLAIQKGDVRYLLQLGIQALRTTTRPGLRALIERIEIDPAGITEDHVGFLIAPRLNALGRLSDANLGVEFLTTPDFSRARIIALQLEALNTRRKFLTASVFQGALAQIRANPELLDLPILVLDNPSWPSGVIGIVASRLVERYGKPVLLITGGEDGIGRGSARSIDGVNITDLLTQVSHQLTTFGGHPMAAGFSLPMSRITEFRNALVQQVQKLVKTESNLLIDGFLPLSSINNGLVLDIERLAPFGPGNPPLTLVSRKMRMKSHTALGKEEEHLSVRVVEEETGMSQRVIWWQGAGWSLPEGIFDLAYHVRSQNVRGETEILVEWVDFRPAGNQTSIVQLIDWAPKIIDYRNEPHPLSLLKMLLAKGEYQVWAEGESVKKLITSGINPQKRDDIEPGETLVIWTIPPGPIELQSVVRSSVPKRILIFGDNPESGNPETFIKRLSGLVRYAINHNQGKVNLQQLAASTAQRVTSIQKGLDWLSSQGFIDWELSDNLEVIILLGKGQPVGRDQTRNWQKMVENINEIVSFRNYFMMTEIQYIRSMIAEKMAEK